MKKNISQTSKHIIRACTGAAAALLLFFSACDFQPAKNTERNRPVGGGLSQGRVLPNEFLESGGGGSGGATIATIQSGDITKKLLTKQEIKELLDNSDAKLLPQNVMEEEPSFTPPYKVGKVKKEALELSLKRLNALRKISGLPPVVMTDQYNEDAQYGAFLMKLTGQFTHGGIPQPSGMDKTFWERGNNATATSNIYPINNLIGAIDGYNRDPGNPGVGHRLYQMSPGQQAVGIGFVPGSHCEKVIGTPAPDDKKPEPFDWNFVSYPAAGYFPLEGNLFGSPAFWHVQFNDKEKYTVGSGKIIVTNLGTGEQWVEEHAGGRIIIFNKSNKWRPELGTYTFEVTGVRNKNTNIPERFVFTTEFFDRHTL